MPIRINGQNYYWTAEACRLAGTSRNTFLRWVREGLIPDVKRRDRRGWRLFSEADIDELKTEVNRLEA